MGTCVRCNKNLKLSLFFSTRNPNGKTSNKVRVLKTCRPCRKTKQEQARYKYALLHPGKKKRSPYKDLLSLLNSGVPRDEFFSGDYSFDELINMV